MNISPKSMITKRLQNAISRADYKDMQIVLPVAEEYKISPRTIKKVSQKIAEFYFKEKHYDQSAIYSNKARSIDPSIKKNFELFCNSIIEFFKTNIDEFSKKDLDEFKKSIIPVIDFHKIKFPSHHKSIDEMENLFKRIDYRKKYLAKDKEESKVTYKVLQIKSAISNDMSLDEVNQEFGKSLSKIIRRKIDQDKRVNKQSTKKENKSKK